MNKEEKDAIENLKKDFILMNNGEYATTDDYILYNYISKLQKENEELKEKNKLQEKTLIEFAKEREKLLNTPVISKDKIKDKIKELEKQCETELLTTWLEAKIEVLKDLLEGE